MFYFKWRQISTENSPQVLEKALLLKGLGAWSCKSFYSQITFWKCAKSLCHAFPELYPVQLLIFQPDWEQSTSNGSSGLCLTDLQSHSWNAVLFTPLIQHLRHEAGAVTSVTTSAWNNIRWLLTAYSNCRLKSRLFAWSCLSSSAKRRKHIHHASE